ncbi:cupin [Acidihalobacter aeolianus]|uniref:Cupin n=1 Tax=Acidihalobacter aeolianus TaxID=2792603 RepID=A0A1D8K649_9GAMM|nr:cupin domain-containing protein [Acidihalobacter aeolianus]AOV16444.1 cupin [Acidihalobacter aeolianus]
MDRGSLLEGIPPTGIAETVERLAGNQPFRIERIISHGHRSPEQGWYDQAQSEWVAVISGAATLEFEDGETLHMQPGDWVDIPAHTRHRVTWTDPDADTVWLAVHY